MTKKSMKTHGNKDALEAGLTDQDYPGRIRSIRHIGQTQDARYVRALLRCYAQSREECNQFEWREISSEIFKTFEIIGTAALEELTESLLDEEVSIRVSSARILALTGCVQATQPLIKALEDKSPEVRRHALRALGMIRFVNDDIEAKVVAAFSDQDPEVASESVVVSGQLKLKTAVPYLTGLVEKIPQRKQLYDQDRDMLYFATRALGYIGDRAATQVLEKTLREIVTDDSYTPDSLSNGIVDALGDLQDSSATKTLILALEHFIMRSYETRPLDDDDFGDRDDSDWLSLTHRKMAERIKKALFNLEQEADSILVKELTQWIRDNGERGDDLPKRFARPRMPRYPRAALFDHPGNAFAGAISEILSARGPAVIDLILPMITDRLPDVRMQGIRILIAFTDDPRTFAALQDRYSLDAESEEVRSAALTGMLKADPVKALELYTGFIAKPRKAEIGPREAHSISWVGIKAAESIRGVLLSSSSDTVKQQSLEALRTFVQVAHEIAPPKKDGKRRSQAFRLSGW